MPKPDTCPSEIYDVILSCWSTNPPSRPSFDFLNTFLHDWQSPSWPKCSQCHLFVVLHYFVIKHVFQMLWYSASELVWEATSDFTRRGMSSYRRGGSFYRRGGIDEMWVSINTSVCCNVFRVILFHGWDLAYCSKLALTVLPRNRQWSCEDLYWQLKEKWRSLVTHKRYLWKNMFSTPVLSSKYWLIV